MADSALVRFLGGPLDGTQQRFEYLVDGDGRPHERLAKRIAGTSGRLVYRLVAPPTEPGGAWLFEFDPSTSWLGHPTAVLAI